MKGRKLLTLLGSVFLVLILAALPFMAGCAKPAPAPAPTPTPAPAPTPAPEKPKETAADFYKGKTIEFVCYASPGGGYDTWARMITPHLEKLTGATVIVRNMTGGGGLVALNYLYNTAKPDGLSILIMNGFILVISQQLKLEGVKYDIAKFNWLARITYDPRVVVVGKDSPLRSIDDFKNAEKVKFGAVGRTASTAVSFIAFAEALGLTNTKGVYGYKGNTEVMLATVSGEVDADCSSVGSCIKLIEAGDLVPIAIVTGEGVPELPGVSTIFELLPDMPNKAMVEKLMASSDVERILLTTPGIPQDRLDFLVEAIYECLHNPELISLAEKMGREVRYLSAPECVEIVKGTAFASEAEKAEFEYLIMEKY